MFGRATITLGIRPHSSIIIDYVEWQCRVFGRLQREIEELREAIRVLEAKLHETEGALMRLRKARTTLEQDIQTKERSLEIDSKVCLGMRKRMATDPKCCPMITVPLTVC